MIISLTIVLSSIFLFLSGLHFYWAFGGAWGMGAVIPTKDAETPPKDPGIIATLIVAIGLLSIAIFIWIKALSLAIYLPSWLLMYGFWVLSGLFFVRAMGDFKYVGFFKRINNTPFSHYDTRYYSPLCLSMAILFIALELML
jgi:hypothetical protein